MKPLVNRLKKLLFTYLVTVSVPCAGQTNIDSLIQIWSNPDLHDTIRLNAIDVIATDAYLFSRPDSAFYFAQLEYDFARERGMLGHMADAANTQGVSFSIRGDYTCAIKHHSKSLKIEEEIGDENGIYSSIIEIGKVYYEQGDYNNATIHYIKGLKAAKGADNKKGIASTLNNLGIIYAEQDSFKKAIACFNESLKTKEDIGDKLGMASSLGNIGSIHSSQGNYDKAVEYFNESFKIHEQMGDKRGMAGSLTRIGEICVIIGDSSIRNNNQRFATDKYTKAIDHIRKALVMANEVGAVTEIRDAAMILYRLNRHLGDYKGSLEMYELYMDMDDSIKNIETQQQVINQDFKDQYDKEVTAHQTKQYVLIGSFILILALSGIYLRIKFIQKRSEKELHLQEIKTSKAESIVKAGSLGALSKPLLLDKLKIESAIEAPLNKSDWNILNTLHDNPVINNREIAEQISLSVDGVRSSLRKMYRLMDINKNTKNQRIALVIKAIALSNNPIQKD
jgi:tetratricopeptide (TPR) repeat protein